MERTLYRRPLPSDAIAFSSPEGRELFAQALHAEGLGGYFPLAEQFHTQSDPSFCGLGSLVMALNALAIDPGRLWKGPWRWFAEDMLDCCVPLPEVRERGLSLDQLGCLARCNGAEVDVERADATNPANLAAWRAALTTAARGGAIVIAAYDRAALGQTGSGHFSPVGGYHAARDFVLILDVARFKYPPHWVPAERLWRAMHAADPTTGRPRGWMTLRRRARDSALGLSVSCNGESWQGLALRLAAVRAEIGAAPDVAALARAVLPLAPHLEMRAAGAPAHQEALAAARAALRGSAAYPQVVAAIGTEHAEHVTTLLFAVSDLLNPTQRSALGSLSGAIVDELNHLRAQFEAIVVEFKPGNHSDQGVG